MEKKDWQALSSEEKREHLLRNVGRGEPEVVRLLTELNVCFVQQHSIGGFFVDIAVPSLSLVIEVDDSSKDLRDPYQLRRSGFIKRQGWRTTRLDSRRCVSDRGWLLQRLISELRRDPSFVVPERMLAQSREEMRQSKRLSRKMKRSKGRRKKKSQVRRSKP